MRVFLVITGVIFVMVGLRALVDPISAVAEPFALTLNGPDAFNYLRGGAGGMTLLAGLVMVAVWRYDWLALPALILVNVILGGLLFGRFVSLLVDGMPTRNVWISAGFEMFGFVQAAAWLYVERLRK
jgi:hypothetical protein